MDVHAPSIAAIRPDAPETIPVLDLAPLIRGEPGAVAALGAELRDAFENVGFYFIINHGVPQSLIDATFESTRRFHAMPLEDKLALQINKDNIGYLPFKGSVTRHSQLNPNNRPNLVEAYFTKRELPPDHPDRLSGLPFRGANRWPANLPGFGRSSWRIRPRWRREGCACCRSTQSRSICRRTTSPGPSGSRCTRCGCRIIRGRMWWRRMSSGSRRTPTPAS